MCAHRDYSRGAGIGVPKGGSEVRQDFCQNTDDIIYSVENMITLTKIDDILSYFEIFNFKFVFSIELKRWTNTSLTCQTESN